MNWRLWTILAALLVTIFQIAPTIIYYARPLRGEVTSQQAAQIGRDLIKRAERLEKETLSWINQLCKECSQKPSSIELDPSDPKRIIVKTTSIQQARALRPLLSRAGASLPFGPAQLLALPQEQGDDERMIYLVRRVGYRSPANSSELVNFVAKSDETNSPYLELNRARNKSLIDQVMTQHPLQNLLPSALEANESAQIELCKRSLPLLDWLQPQVKCAPYFWHWLLINQDNRHQAQLQLVANIEQIIDEHRQKIKEFDEQVKRSKEKQQPAFFQQEPMIFELRLLQPKLRRFADLLSSWNANDVQCDPQSNRSENLIHPIFCSTKWNFADGRVRFFLHPELDLKKSGSHQEGKSAQFIHSWLMEETRRIARATGETSVTSPLGIDVLLDSDPQHSNFLTLDLSVFAKQEVAGTSKELASTWKPKQRDLQLDQYPIVDVAEYQAQDLFQQQHCILITAPSSDRAPFQGLKANAVYVIAKNLLQIERASRLGPPEKAAQIHDDLKKLDKIMNRRGYLALQERDGLDIRLKDSAIFELPNFAEGYLSATREHFRVLPDQRYCLLPLGNIGQRLRELNRIETETQEDLLKWRDAYRAAQVDLNRQSCPMPPPPTVSAFWENAKLSARKYLRGDLEKALKWGLDLTGGKCLRVGLFDLGGRQIAQLAELQQGRDELYARVNALGINEVAIRIDGAHLVLDFPGSRDLSADELIRASSMSFHIVNERFSSDHPQHGTLVNEFLKGVWDEAVLADKKDAESLTEIARQHLAEMDQSQGQNDQVSADLMGQLRALGLKFPDREIASTSELDESISMIASFQNDDMRGWFRQSHPLVIVFKNRALQGADLEEISHQFDPSRGHALSFRVKRGSGADLGSARNAFLAWTQQFAKDQIVGTPREIDRKGGWRMAVILQSSIVSMPELTTPLRDSGSIAGNFSQREVQQLARDLKAGSLTFTPKILSEDNIDAQLGKADRTKGILAAGMGFCGVLVLMIARYGFMGASACAALCFNLLIVWAILQNLGATLTLPGLAGLVLTMGMAVDANVLIFERMREELKNLAPIKALRLGYRRALPAIIDSNITTALTALLLVQFDLGPIKGFAITLIAGLLSSMFSALFVTNALVEAWLTKGRDLRGFARKSRLWSHLNCLPRFKLALALSALLIIFGSGAAWKSRHTLIGLDFTGGTSLTLQLRPECAQNSRDRVTAALRASGLHPGQFNVRQLSSQEQLRIELGDSVDLSNWLAHKNGVAPNSDQPHYPFQSDARISAVIAVLQDADLKITENNAQNLHHQWSTTSSQFSSSMKNRALLSIGIALLLSLIYLALRFEWSYALASGLGLAHTLCVTASIACCLHMAHFPIELNLYAFGAAMTIIGYSLNDMIIVFDRVREDRKLQAKKPLLAVVASAIDQTLSRTAMTCGTTMIALIFLLLFGGESLFAFSSVMALGVLTGTISSLYIAAPLFCRLEKWRLQSLKVK